MKKNNFQTLGYSTSVLGVAIVLIWIGVFKFTAAEAKAIESLVKNSFLMSWLYEITGTEGVSNIIGSIEIIAAICLLLHFFWKRAGVIGGLLSALIFLLPLVFYLPLRVFFQSLRAYR